MTARPPESVEDRSFAEALGQTIRVLRTDQALGRSDLANLAGISYSYLSAIENGVKPPSTRIQALIARALGVRHHELLAAAEARREKGTGIAAMVVSDDPTIYPPPLGGPWEVIGAAAEAIGPHEHVEGAPGELVRLIGELPDADVQFLLQLARRFAGR